MFGQRSLLDPTSVYIPLATDIRLIVCGFQPHLLIINNRNCSRAKSSKPSKPSLRIILSAEIGRREDDRYV